MPAQQLNHFQERQPHGTPAKHASGLGLEIGVGVVAAVSRGRKQSHCRGKNLSRLVTKPYLIETVLFYAGTSEQVRLCGQIYSSCEMCTYRATGT